MLVGASWQIEPIVKYGRAHGSAFHAMNGVTLDGVIICMEIVTDSFLAFVLCLQFIARPLDLPDILVDTYLPAVRSAAWFHVWYSDAFAELIGDRRLVPHARQWYDPIISFHLAAVITAVLIHNLR